MVGIDRKKENSNAADRDIPAIWPAAMVDIDLDVPGKTAEVICAMPIQIACGKLIASISNVLGEVNNASTAHMIAPPMISAAAI